MISTFIANTVIERFCTTMGGESYICDNILKMNLNNSKRKLL